MKRSIVFSFLLFFIFINASATGIYIPLSDDIPQPPPGPVPASITFDYPVSAIIDETDLIVYFDWSVGYSTITVYDSSNTAVYQTFIDTNSVSEIIIPIEYWDVDTYKLKINYGATNLKGYFQIP